jgi:hypothetical protein
MLMKIFVALLCVGLVGCTSPLATGAELSKADATKLLESMGNTKIVVAAVVNGTGMLAYGPNVAMVFAYAERNGQPQKIETQFVHDKEFGWVYAEIDTTGRRVRLWTTSGYQELRPNQ